MRSIKLLIFLISVLTIHLGCARQNSGSNLAGTGNSASDKYAKLKAQADELNQATIKGDDQKAADLTYPKLLEVMGGRDQYIQNLQSVRAEMQEEKFSIVSATVDDPHDVVEVDKQIFAIVPLTLRMQVPEGILVGQSSMIAISSDGGQNWTFVAANRAQLTDEMLKTLFPTAADKLKIPEPTKPVLERQTQTP